MSNKIFISYSGSLNKKLGEYLIDIIKSLTMVDEIFLSSENINGGELWFKKINDALESSRVGIILFSRDTRERSWLFLEYGVLSYKAETNPDEAILVIPVYLDFSNSEWPDNPLKNYNAISFPDKGFEDSLTELITQIHNIFPKLKNNINESIKNSVSNLKNSPIASLIENYESFYIANLIKNLSQDDLKILNKMRMRTNKEYGYTTFSYIELYLQENICENCYPESYLSKLKINKYIHEERILGERVFFITESGMKVSLYWNRSNSHRGIIEYEISSEKNKLTKKS
ncbi:toll/interleukin-1 receptor domain-containing protein [Thiothrix sp.]|jgi:hypothetical protein|uniref:toll/interleukin-1 receptor domain-containing protein n=1 Tax=Thiothrix sp. TaxID=1032 RepID=UPI00257BC120|nr:toll/interleukin-1 receptor domain-containing protein [Thiothrix sp.]